MSGDCLIPCCSKTQFSNPVKYDLTKPDSHICPSWEELNECLLEKDIRNGGLACTAMGVIGLGLGIPLHIVPFTVGGAFFLAGGILLLGRYAAVNYCHVQCAPANPEEIPLQII